MVLRQVSAHIKTRRPMISHATWFLCRSVGFERTTTCDGACLILVITHPNNITYGMCTEPIGFVLELKTFNS